VIEVTQRIAMIGSRAVISDAGVATLAAHAALRSAALNVDINVPAIKDAEFVRTRRARLIELLQRSAAISEETIQTVHGRLA
jgi:methenyltetrahydrofolate cyclohydrolase